MRRITLGATLFILGTVLAGCQDNQDQPANLSTEAKSKRQIAQELSTNYQDFETQLTKQISEDYTSVPLNELVANSDDNDLQAMVFSADQAAVTKRGINGETSSLLNVSLADPEMIAKLKDGEKPLFTYQPDSVEAGDTVEMFDINGETVLGSADVLPEQPVFIVGVDEKEAMRAGLSVMRTAFEENNMPGFANQLKIADTSTDDKEFISTTVLKKISLQDDHEPWISGKAEIYALVSGVSPSRDEPKLDVVEMPYLDYQGKDYYPNQIMIYWDRYRWGAANIVLMEHDSNTNYRDLAKVIVKAASQIIASQVDGGVLSAAIVGELVNEIIKVIPDDAFTNNDDLVDYYYTIEQNQVLTDQPGASGNAMATFEPKDIQRTK